MYLVFALLAFRVSHVLGRRLGEVGVGRGEHTCMHGLDTFGMADIYETRGVHSVAPVLGYCTYGRPQLCSLLRYESCNITRMPFLLSYNVS